MEKTLVTLREKSPRTIPDYGTIDGAMREISIRAGRKHAGTGGSPLSDRLLGYLRPALSIGLLAAAALYIAQESRDALKVSDLEYRLHTHGDAVVTGSMKGNDLGTFRKLLSPGPAVAAMGGVPPGWVETDIFRLFRRHTTLFDQLSRRYPRLSGITPGDGLDEDERTILETDGKELIKEFEHLISQGAKKP